MVLLYALDQELSLRSGISWVIRVERRKECGTGRRVLTLSAIFQRGRVISIAKENDQAVRCVMVPWRIL
jgi:hypothetical protein